MHTENDEDSPTGDPSFDDVAGRPEPSVPLKLLAQVYEQLRASAQSQMRSERADHTLTATALVHEAYLRLASGREVAFQERAHFYAAAVEAMRRVLLDHAKAHGRQKRGANFVRVDLDAPVEIRGGTASVDLLAIDEAVCGLKERDPRMAEIVRLRFYGGLTVEETAHVLGISARTVQSDWTFARAWLARDLGGSAEPA